MLTELVLRVGSNAYAMFACAGKTQYDVTDLVVCQSKCLSSALLPGTWQPAACLNRSHLILNYQREIISGLVTSRSGNLVPMRHGPVAATDLLHAERWRRRSESRA
jgi:hypothetical protein